jgi:hypothetical protein
VSQKSHVRETFVAVCDILGFSEFVAKVSLEDVVEHGLGGLRHALYFSMYGEDPADDLRFVEFARHDEVGVTWFSDTILLYTKSDTDKAIRSLMSILSSLVFFMMSGQTRLRAGVAYGPAHIDAENAMYVGQPIVDAARLEQEQQWAGGALHHTAYERIRRVAGDEPPMDWWVVSYDVPLKNARKLRTFAVNWNEGIHPPSWRLLWSPESDTPSPKDWQTQPNICEKFVNTKTFHEKYCRDCGRSDAGVS